MSNESSAAESWRIERARQQQSSSAEADAQREPGHFERFNKCANCGQEIFRYNIAPFTWTHTKTGRAPCVSYATPVTRSRPTVEAAEIRRQALEALADARECDNCEVAPAVWERSDDPETHWYVCDEHKDSQMGWRENKAVRFAMTVAAARDAAPTDPEKD